MTRALASLVEHYRAAPRIAQLALFLCLMSSAALAEYGIGGRLSAASTLVLLFGSLGFIHYAEHDHCEDCGASYSVFADNYCSECGGEVNP